MVEIRTLTTFQVDDLARIMPGYTSREKYEVHQDVSADDETIRFFLRRVALREPCVKRWDYDADEILRGGA